MKKLFVLLLIFACGCVWAQDFGFGSDEDLDLAESESINKAAFVKIGGSATVELSSYFRGAQEFSFWDILSGKLNLSAGISFIEINSAFNVNYNSIMELWNKSPKLKSDFTYTPLLIDEAFLKAFIGSVNVEAGYRKLAWGKADSPGPLDVTNPMDYSDLRNITDVKSIKISRPMIHITCNTGSFSKIEGVFIPNFYGHRFAEDGRWQPSQTKNMLSTVETGISSMAAGRFGTMASDPAFLQIFEGVKENLSSYFDDNPVAYPSTGAVDQYYQAGLRYTTTIGSADIGAQYFYGHLFRPTFTISGVDAYLDDLKDGILGANPPLTMNPLYRGDPSLMSPEIKYNRYHQIGIDYAQVLLGFNIRAEFAIHLTGDLSGNKGSVQNPFIGWSVGFDRELFWGINLNLQCNETIRLLNGKIGDNPILDAEAGTKATSTRITARLSKSFLMDKLESSATVIWDIENLDVYIIPALSWTKDNLSVKLSAGIFAGKETGDLGQYWKNSYIRFGMTYSLSKDFNFQ